MMESPNQNQHPQQLLHCFSSTQAPSAHIVGGNHQRSQNLTTVNGGDTSNAKGVIPCSRYLLSRQNQLPPLITPMVQELGFQGASDEEKNYMNHPTNQAPLATIKEEHSTDSFPKIGEIFSDPSPEVHQFSSTVYIDGLQYGSSGGNLNKLIPAVNISSLIPVSSRPVSLDMDLQSLDILASGWTLGQPSVNSMALFREGIPLGLLQEQTQGPSYCYNMVSSLVSGVKDTKKSNGTLDHGASQKASKTHQSETCISSPFKVRKEKLGDRVAALQQLVAPFGKTDTASVLMEAIGYIKFLLDQVEALSVPCMSSSSNKKQRTIQGASNKDIDGCKLDLRSRGLCLMPLSCMSFFTDENGNVWSLPNLGEASEFRI